MSMAWPIILIVASDLFYQISTKSLPQQLDPYASLTITYMVGAALAFLLYETIGKGGNILHEWAGINWTTFVLGLSIVGLEVGSIFMYRVGWQVNTGYVLKSILIACMLVVVGYVLYKEPISTNKVIGIIVCMVGIYILNK